jgi:AraC-like DNA-binding protein
VEGQTKHYDVRGAEAWEQACCESFVPLGVDRVEPAFIGRLTTRFLPGGVHVARGTCTVSEIVRGPRLIAREPRDHVLFSYYLSGEGQVEQRGRVAELRAGHGAFYHSDDPYQLRFPTAMEQIVIQVPRAGLGRAAGDLDRLVAHAMRCDESTALRVLATMVPTIVDGDPGDDPPGEGDALAHAIVTLLRSVAERDAALRGPVQDSRIALREAVLLDLETHFVDPGLRPADVAARHHISLRLLYSLLEDVELTPAGYMRELRLKAAHRLLGAGGAVGDVAYSVGFRDVGTFRRAYRRRFGAPPGRTRG